MGAYHRCQVQRWFKKKLDETIAMGEVGLY